MRTVEHVFAIGETNVSNLLDVGTKKQLFIDGLVIDEEHGVTRNLNQPSKYVGNPIMIPLYPWEGRLELYGTVWREPNGLFRMWYQGLGGMGTPALDYDGSPLAKIPGQETTWEKFQPSNLLMNVCYATSDNGIHWERPNLGIEEYQGSRDNNIVILDAGFGNVIKDTRDPDPDRLYKALFWESPDFDPSGKPNTGESVSVAFSPDGIHWTKYPGNPVLTRSSDTHMLLGWDELHGKYVAYPRPTTREGDASRRIGRSTSQDFENWTEIEEVLRPDSQDPFGMEFYGMPVFKYEDMYIGQLYALHARPEEVADPSQTRNDSVIDVQLTSSRDGVIWERAGGRNAFIPNGVPGSIDSGEIWTAKEPVIVENEIWFYYCAGAMEHGITGRSGPICLAKLRLDGFVSVDAGEDAGSLITKPFRCEGGPLEINASARGGVVEVAVLDESGIQYQGYSRQECALFDGDSVDHCVTWREKLSLEELKGNTIRLKFYLQNASLYSFNVGNK